MGNRGFVYKNKRWIGSEGLDQENNGPLRRGWTETAGRMCGNENTGSLFGMTLHCNERKTN